MHCLPVLSLVYFRNLSLLSETCKANCLDVSPPSIAREVLTEERLIRSLLRV